MQDQFNAEAGAARLSVLVVDDDPFYLTLIKRQLEQLGVTQTRTADDGASALYQLQLDPKPTLVFCDLQMPTMNGLDFMRQLRLEGFPGEIVLISSETERTLAAASQLIRAYGLRLLATLEKPVRAATLASIMNRVGQSRAAPMEDALRRHSDSDIDALLSSSRLDVLFQPCLQLSTLGVSGLIARASDARDDTLSALDPGSLAHFGNAPKNAKRLIETMLPLALSGCAPILREQPEWWLALDLPICLLDNEELLEQLETTARSCDFPLSRLRLHLVGSVSESWSDRALSIAGQLALRGVALWAGGQDVGYVALEQLLQLPLQGLSLDPRLIRRAAETRTAETILLQLVALSKSLELSMQATGIGSDPQLQLCALAGCELGSGEQLAPALPASAVAAWANWYRPKA